jgi:hypothetical protein
MKIRFPNLTVKNWLAISIFNLLIVSALGLLMRLKIILPLAFVNQQYILHAHSHFAFSGWLSQVMMVLLVTTVLGTGVQQVPPPRYQSLFWSNLIAAYGMLITFSIQGLHIRSFGLAGYQPFSFSIHHKTLAKGSAILFGHLICRYILSCLPDEERQCRSQKATRSSIFLFTFSVQWMVLSDLHGFGKPLVSYPSTCYPK